MARKAIKNADMTNEIAVSAFIKRICEAMEIHNSKIVKIVYHYIIEDYTRETFHQSNHLGLTEWMYDAPDQPHNGDLVRLTFKGIQYATAAGFLDSDQAETVSWWAD